MSLFKTAWDLKNGKYRMVNGNSPFKNIFIYFLTGYTVPGEPNINKCNYTVRFSKIESVKPSRTLMAAPASGLKRLEVQTIEGVHIIISPKKQEEFISHIKKINPNIKIK